MLKDELNVTKYKKWSPVNLFSPEELKLYKELLNYFLPKNIFVLTKVKLADLVKSEKNIEFSERQSTFMKLNQRHIDFVLTDCKGKILCLIELDGNSHNYDVKTKKSDEFKNEFFEIINIPLVRFKNYTNHNLLILDQYV